MDPGTAAPIALNDEVRAIRELAEGTAKLAQRLELKVDALCQMLKTNRTITADDYKRITLWGTEGVR